jgi:hypothetical protein
MRAHTHTHTPRHAHTHTHPDTHTLTRTHPHSPTHTHTPRHAHTHTHPDTHTQPLTHTPTLANTHTHTPRHTHTHTHAEVLKMFCFYCRQDIRNLMMVYNQILQTCEVMFSLKYNLLTYCNIYTTAEGSRHGS